MSKRIVFCADGTWDDPQNETNVYTISKALKQTPGEQVLIYEDGVGQKLLGGAFGTGLFQKIKDGYTRIAISYDPNDEIFLFGFSRGAYTARSLAGMIAIIGLPTEPFTNQFTDTAFQAYRDKDQRAALLASLGRYGMYDAKIKMIGVWDTVGSLGIPAIIGLADPLLYGFLDTTLHPDVLNAYQALAIDERRAQFPPTLWTSQPTPGQTIEQVWFAGVHCDVGGSYPETSLSDITIGWMMGKAKALGLDFDDDVWAKYSNIDPKHALGTIHESWNPAWGVPHSRTIGDTAVLSNSVTIRCAHDASYRPDNLRLNDGVPVATYKTVQVVLPPRNGNFLQTSPDRPPTQSAESEGLPTPSGEGLSGEGYTSGPAGYTSEFCGVGGSRAVADYLGVEPLAHRLAELIALRETKLPLAVGLFGNWGSGKSHFMNLMDRHMKKLAHETPHDWAHRVVGPVGPPILDPIVESPWCCEIVPIYFNAWHYLDTNLWASLVTEIFDGLFRHLEPKQDELALMHSQLRNAGGATARAEEEVAHAHEAVGRASAALQEARARSEGVRQAIRGLLNNLRTLLPQVNTAQNRRQIEEWLGVSADVATLSQLVEKHREMASLPGRLRELWRRLSASKGLLWRLGWLAGMLVVGPWTVRFAAESVPFLKDLLGHVGPLFQRALGEILGVIAWLSPAVVEIQRRLGQMESWQEQAEEAQAVRPQDHKVIEAQKMAVDAEASAAAAEARLAVAKALEEQLTQALDELRPERRLSRFIEARARSTEYRGQLGLVSLARRDFQELSDIFADKEALRRKMDELPEQAEQLAKLSASIDRIVLFVDDLDRCQPETVVDVLQAVHLLLAYPLFAVVVGVDQRCLRQSLRMQFKGLLTSEQIGVGHKSGVDEGEHLATPLDYLEKVFHVPFHLPTMGEQGYATLIERLTEPLPSEMLRTASETAGSAVDPRASGEQPLQPSAVTTPLDAATSVGGGSSLGESAASATHSANPPHAPMRLIGSVPLQPWERKAIKAYHPLIRTPRGATRLLNTYRLVRSGIPAEEWDMFRGDGAMHGEFRIAMLLLASSAGYPAVAREWFEILRNANPSDVFQSEAVGTDPLAWMQFKKVYNATFEHTEPGLTKELLAKWIERVEQFAF